jgi:hypothetical protein
MITGMQRLAPWVIRVLIFKIVYPFVLYLNPNNDMLRLTSRSASDVLEATFAAFDGRKKPKDKY